MSAEPICPILLAAGRSQRFGSDKLIYPLSWYGKVKPLIVHTLSPWLKVFSQLTVVIRDDNRPLINVLENSEFASRLKLVGADKADQGMSASLVSGIKSDREADGWLIGLADMPFISDEVIRDSRVALEDGAAISQPCYQGYRGHPVGFASRFLPQLLTLSGDKGAKAIINANLGEVVDISSPDDGILRDIDTRSSINQA